MISGKAELARIKASCAAPGHLTTTFVNLNTANNFFFRVEQFINNKILYYPRRILAPYIVYLFIVLISSHAMFTRALQSPLPAHKWDGNPSYI